MSRTISLFEIAGSAYVSAKDHRNVPAVFEERSTMMSALGTPPEMWEVDMADRTRALIALIAAATLLAGCAATSRRAM